jgi:hypothetical protein
MCLLKDANIGCFIGNVYTGALADADVDDVTLLAHATDAGVGCLNSVISMPMNFLFYLTLIRAYVLSLDQSGSKLMRFPLNFLLAAIPSRMSRDDHTWGT